MSRNQKRSFLDRAYPDLLTWRTAPRPGRPKGFSQQEAADLLGLTQSSYARYERGAIFLKGNKARELMARTGVPLEVLAGISQ